MPASNEEIDEAVSIKTETDYLKQVDVNKPVDGTPRVNRVGFKVLKVHEIAEIVKAINDQNYHSIIAISGKVGTGKSTLALEIGYVINKLYGKYFSIMHDVIYTREAFYKRITEAKQFDVIVSDESMNLFYKREFADKEQKGLLKLLDMIRYKNLTIILCVPNFWALDTHVINSQVRFWIHVTKRKLGWIFVPSDNPFSSDPWSRNYNELALQKHFIPKNSLNFFSGIYFNKLRAPIERTYIKHKEKQSMLSAEFNKKILYTPKDIKKIKIQMAQRRFWNTIGLLKKLDLLDKDYPLMLGKLMKRSARSIHASVTNGLKYKYKIDEEWFKEVKKEDIIKPKEPEPELVQEEKPEEVKEKTNEEVKEVVKEGAKEEVKTEDKKEEYDDFKQDVYDFKSDFKKLTKKNKVVI